MTSVSERAHQVVGAATLDEGTLRRFLHGLPGVDQVGADARAATLTRRVVTGPALRQAVDLAVRMTDLTTLEGADTPGTVRALCAQAVRPDAADPTCPPVAAVCVYPDLVPVARQAVQGSGVEVAAVATAFPSGRASLSVRLADVAEALHAGADEIDMVIDRGAFLTGAYGRVHDDIVAVRELCRSGGRAARLKVILETGELGTYDDVRRASWLAMLAGADFIKTSTGKVSPAATLPVTLVMLQAVRDFHRVTGARVGVKPAGGIRTTQDAVRYLVAVHETAGDAWLHPDRFRFGASRLLTDLVRRRRALASDETP